MVGTGDPHPLGKSGSFGCDFIETDEKDKEGSGNEKIAKQKAFADEESADYHKKDTGNLKRESKVVDADEGENKTAEKEDNTGEVSAREHL